GTGVGRHSHGTKRRASKPGHQELWTIFQMNQQPISSGNPSTCKPRSNGRSGLDQLIIGGGDRLIVKRLPDHARLILANPRLGEQKMPYVGADECVQVGWAETLSAHGFTLAATLRNVLI